MIRDRVLDTPCADQTRAYFEKMVADYYRYMAEYTRDATKLLDV